MSPRAPIRRQAPRAPRPVVSLGVLRRDGPTQRGCLFASLAPKVVRIEIVGGDGLKRLQGRIVQTAMFAIASLLGGRPRPFFDSFLPGVVQITGQVTTRRTIPAATAKNPGSSTCWRPRLPRGLSQSRSTPVSSPHRRLRAKPRYRRPHACRDWSPLRGRFRPSAAASN